MTLQRFSPQVIKAGWGLLLAVGCTVSTTSTPIAILSTATSLPPTPTLEEKYEEIDPGELNLVVEGSIQSFTMDDETGDIEAVEGTVTQITVGGKPIALSSNEIVVEDNEAFIVTRDYGKNKVTVNAVFGRIVLWLKPSQKEIFKELLK